MTTELQELKSRLERAERRARLSWACALGALALTVLLNLRPIVLAQSPDANLASLAAAVTALQQKTQFMSADPTAKSTTFSGCNVFVNDGGHKTSAIVHNAAGQGLGNLIIGYNATDSYFGDIRKGSHNLILGDQNNYTSYGGIVDGIGNAIKAPYASVYGGSVNTASGECASVCGGFGNAATGFIALVCGGAGNHATGAWASISGGADNEASGTWASINGGHNLTQSRDFGSSEGSTAVRAHSRRRA
jgi:hypothetical protein